MARPDGEPERDAPEPRRASDHLKLYLREPTLWPVATAAALIFVTFGAAGLLLALQRSLPAIAAVALLAAMTADQVVRELRSGGPGWVTGLAAGFWGLSAACAFAASRLGIF